MNLAVLMAAIAFFAWGVAAERIASVWPAGEASRRGPGLRSALIGGASALVAAALAARSELPPWATAAYLAFLALLVLLTATDLEQRILPHVALDPLLIGTAAFVPFNPAVSWQSAIAGALLAVAVLGGLGLLIRGGIALGDLYLVAPLGLLVGISGIFVTLFVAGLLAGATSAVLLAVRAVRLKSYIPFGPFLVAGASAALITGPQLVASQVAATPLPWLP